MMTCEFCGMEMPVSMTPFDDKEHFDQAFYDSIQMPKRPASARKWALILSVISLPFVLAAWPMIFVLGPMVYLVCLGMKGSEDTWKHCIDNPEWYKRMVYNMDKRDEWTRQRKNSRRE